MGIIRYFAADKKYVDKSGYKLSLMPDNDVLPLDILQDAVVIAETEYKYILKVWLLNETIQELQSQTGAADPLSIEASNAMDLADSYIGTTIEDVIKKFPELEGTYVAGQDEDGHDLVFPKIKNVGCVIK